MKRVRRIVVITPQEITMTQFFKRRRRGALVTPTEQVATTEPSAPEAAGPAIVDGFIGEVRLTAASYAPAGWALCHGQLLPINSYQPLFSLLGTTYGGDGRTTFGLPDMRGRTAIGAGQAGGLAEHRLGRAGDDNPGQGPPDHGYLTLNYVICLEGVYPSRT
jgi:microcystin-dependent protein